MGTAWDESEAGQTRAAWLKAGSPYCDHSRRHREILLGQDSGDFVCIGCGETWIRTGPVPTPNGVRPKD
jgi:hypothetical protein